VADATGQPGIEAQPVAEGDTDALSACGFVSNDVLPVVITTILDPANTNTDASSYLALPGSVEVPVNGARAIFMPAAGFVMAVVKDATVVTFQVAVPATGEDFLGNRNEAGPEGRRSDVRPARTTARAAAAPPAAGRSGPGRG
jgi:hypothetical protein